MHEIFKDMFPSFSWKPSLVQYKNGKKKLYKQLHGTEMHGRNCDAARGETRPCKLPTHDTALVDDTLPLG